jgi:hypothetical protein
MELGDGTCRHVRLEVDILARVYLPEGVVTMIDDAHVVFPRIREKRAAQDFVQYSYDGWASNLMGSSRSTV